MKTKSHAPTTNFKYNNSSTNRTIVALLLILLFVAVNSGLIYSRFLSPLDIGISTIQAILDFDTLITLFQINGLLISVIFGVYQLSDSKEIARATFISDLNKSFVENENFKRIYDILQDDLDNTDNPSVSTIDFNSDEESIKKSSISNYLTFFESIYLLQQKGVITIDIIDDLFAYRFFLAVHSQLFQEKKLLTQPENFLNIFKLERLWLDYRVKIGKLSKEDLIKAESPNAPLTKNVYTTRTFKFMLGKEEYEKLLYK